ncbi:hypothetical protein TWF281_011443 [Arthrobotrys megalospora]
MESTPPRPQKPYPHPFDHGEDAPLFATDSDQRKAVLDSVTNFRAQPDWIEKLSDRTTTIEWLRKAIAPPRGSSWTARLDPNWMTAEDVYNVLIGYKEYILKLREEGVSIEPDADASTVWTKTEFLGDELRREFIDAVKILEDTPYSKRGWGSMNPEQHPSRLPNGAWVTDLLDPHMYPIVYGSTLYTEDLDGSFELVPKPGFFDDEHLDDDTCWLPTEYEVAEDGQSTKIHSYINNLALPGQSKLLHPFFETIFTGFIPSFNHVLADSDRYPWRKGWQPPETYTEINKKYAAKHLWTPPEISSAHKLEGKTLNIVTRLINIEVTPDRPVYDARDWHTDGMANERVAATGIYLYAQENIADPSLHLRHRSYHSLAAVTPRPIVIKQNSTVTFTNIYEHCISTFHLLNPQKSGYLKLLIFHLFDPFTPNPVPSTRQIPPQQPGQYQHEQLLRKTPIGEFPEEIFRDILDYTAGNTIPVEEAVDWRWRMMRARDRNVRDGYPESLFSQSSI